MAKIIKIDNLSAPELDIYARLTDRTLLYKQHPDDAVFVAESPWVIEPALDKGCRPISFLMEEKHIEGTAKDILKRCPADIPVYTAEDEILAQITGFHLTRGVLCVMKRPALPNADELLSKAQCIAVLANVMNPENTGAIFRSAAALGLDAVLLTDEGSDPLTRRASRVSMGTVFKIPWAYFPSDGNWQKILRDHGFKTVATVLRDDSRDIRDTDLKDIKKTAIVLGNEGYGLEGFVIEGCDYAVKIPMAEGVDSLNVGAAAAIAFYQFNIVNK